MTRMIGKVALITGAARGQGRSHAVRLAEEGADIIALDICSQIDTVKYPMASLEDLKETKLLVEKTGQRILTLVVDVRDPRAVKDAVAAGLKEFDRIDVACVNHGISQMVSVLDMSDDEWRDMIDVNLTGVFNTVRAVLPTMVASETSSSIVMTSSVSAVRGYANSGHYSAAKAGMVGLMKTLVNEISEHNVRVNCVLPSAVATPMIQNDFLDKVFDAENPSRESTERIFREMNRLPVSWMDPRDLSNAVLFLASDEARWITGVSLPVDAGLLAKV